MPRKTTPKVSEVVALFQASRKAQVAKTTWVNDSSLLNVFAREVGDPQIHLLTRVHIEDYFAGRAEQKATSWNKSRSRLGTFFDWCQRRGYIEGDLLSDIRPRKVIKQRRLQLDVVQLTQLLDSCVDPRERAFIAVAMNTGLRASTITSIKVKDVDLAHGILRVFVTKSQYEDELPITSDLDAELRRWLLEAQRELKRPLAPEEYLLGTRGPRRGRLINGQYQQGYGNLQPDKRIVHAAAIVKRALARIGIETVLGEGVHTVRRSVARIMFDQASAQGHDAALRITASLLGHASVQTTELYLGLDQDRAKRDELLRGKSLFTVPDNVVQLPVQLLDQQIGRASGA